MSKHSSAGRVLAGLISAAFIAAGANVAGWQGQGGPPAQGAPPAAGQAGGGRGRGGTPPVAYDDYTGYTKIWDGTTFTNWSGESDVWSIENGMLHADTTKTPGQHHIYYTGPNAVMTDFDLKVEFKISATGANGGIQYRSRLLHVAHGGSTDDPLGKPLPEGITTVAQAVAAGLTTQGGGGNRGAGAPGGRGNAPRGAGAPPAGAATGGNPTAVAGGSTAAATPTGACRTGGGPGPTSGPNIPATTGNPWQVSGYQFDLDSNNQYTGQLYEGQGRSIVNGPGTIAQLVQGKPPICIGVITDTPAALVKAHMGTDGEWNQVQIIARGNVLTHMINGHVISVTIDDNPAFRASKGILSLQLEGSGQIWYRNVYVKAIEK